MGVTAVKILYTFLNTLSVILNRLYYCWYCAYMGKFISLD